jgi:hypothetical protein
MGDELNTIGAITIQAKLPSIAEVQLIRNGMVIKKARTEAMTYTTDEPGVYRLEAYRRYLGKLRGWIFSNPIYVKQGLPKQPTL